MAFFFAIDPEIYRSRPTQIAAPLRNAKKRTHWLLCWLQARCTQHSQPPLWPLRTVSVVTSSCRTVCRRHVRSRDRRADVRSCRPVRDSGGRAVSSGNRGLRFIRSWTAGALFDEPGCVCSVRTQSGRPSVTEPRRRSTRECQRRTGGGCLRSADCSRWLLWKERRHEVTLIVMNTLFIINILSYVKHTVPPLCKKTTDALQRQNVNSRR